MVCLTIVMIYLFMLGFCSVSVSKGYTTKWLATLYFACSPVAFPILIGIAFAEILDDD